jgi:glutamate-5-semialdehyde dehydrogenase
LIRYVADHATMPVLTGGTGVCHTYVDAAADIDKAVRIAHNAKTRRFTISADQIASIANDVIRLKLDQHAVGLLPDMPDD